MAEYRSASGSSAEDLFIELFADTFGAEKAGYLYSQYPFYDIYQNARFADFVLENGATRVAIEIDDQASHDPRHISVDKFCDDLLKQNSMAHLGWDIYRFAVRQMQKQPETVKDELRVFLGNDPRFKEIEDYLPTQQGKAFDGEKLELREYQQEALDSLEAMRANKETIALLYHATGTGKTVTAVMDAKRCGGRVLFVAHTMELVNQAYNTFKNLWETVSIGKFADSVKDTDSHVICGSIQSVALNLELFRDDAFDYIIIDEAHHASADTYQKVLAYFKPKFTLGLTATPERADDTNILEIFKNTAHKLDIQTAVEIGALVPVRCIRIHTNIDMTKVRFNIEFISAQIEAHRVQGKLKALAFCRNVTHARMMCEAMGERYKTAYLTGRNNIGERIRAYNDLQSDEADLEILFTVDILNEGVDIPGVNMVLFLRPTESSTIFIQQLGRGLRKFDNKPYVTVLDFIGNSYKRSVQIAFALGSLSKNLILEKKLMQQLVRDDFAALGLAEYGVEINVDDLSKEEIINYIENENFNSLTYMKQDYFNFKKYINSEFYPKHMDFLNNDCAPDLLRFMSIKIGGKKNVSYYNFLRGIEEEICPYSQNPRSRLPIISRQCSLSFGNMNI